MTVIYTSPIFGPIHSRRLGVSLGINLLPGDGKCCSFDCIYCECGFNSDFVPKQKLPTREQVREALEAQLKKMQAEGPAPDVLTFAGNGEPTLNPHFPEIIDDTIALRNQYFPDAKVSVLTNATQIVRKPVFDALCKVDNNICKLDTISADYINAVDRPNGKYDVDAIIAKLKEFGNRCIIQTMFMKGEYEGKSTSNVSENFVAPWLDAVREIKPREVMIYTIDRETPAQGLEKAIHEELDAIGERVRDLGIACKVAY
ncbi:MAG: radical SAM protein [Prevotellaceae bacterium]|nr:radical SAM protein [Candidatus Minthosoma caballi]